ncbi:MAG: M23 family metallopeptidase [Endomicrobiia bacterium]|nr:M23 family metallopeptidase [Endomicrobiia bacterium]
MKIKIGGFFLTSYHRHAARIFAAGATLFFSTITLYAFSINPAAPKGGEAFVFSFKPSGFLTYEIIYDSKTYITYLADNGKREIFLPVAIESSGEGKVVVVKKLLGIKIAEAKIPVRITPREIEVVRLRPPSEKMRDSKPPLPDERERLLASLKTVTAANFRDSPFIPPLEGKRGEGFAVRREGAKYSYYHKGVDISTPAGVPVTASNSGAVAISSENFNVTGKTIVIDHGRGLLTCYYHMDSLLVSEGEKVARGQIIGTVGSTGWSTGPHLHFGAYLQGEAIDPLWLIEFTSTTK